MVQKISGFAESGSPARSQNHGINSTLYPNQRGRTKRGVGIDELAIGLGNSAKLSYPIATDIFFYYLQSINYVAFD